jgi:hypothetical protein
MFAHGLLRQTRKNRALFVPEGLQPISDTSQHLALNLGGMILKVRMKSTIREQDILDREPKQCTNRHCNTSSVTDFAFTELSSHALTTAVTVYL